MLTSLTKYGVIDSGPAAQRESTVFQKLYDTIFYGGYLAASERALRDTVSRYARGNIALQFKRYLTADQLHDLHIDGDKAAKRLAKRIDRATR
jgi:hypothetical protein